MDNVASHDTEFVRESIIGWFLWQIKIITYVRQRPRIKLIRAKQTKIQLSRISVKKGFLSSRLLHIERYLQNGYESYIDWRYCWLSISMILWLHMLLFIQKFFYENMNTYSSEWNVTK